MESEYVDQNREGDHICCLSDLSKLRRHYPAWTLSKSLDDIFQEIHQAMRNGEHGPIHRSGGSQESPSEIPHGARSTERGGRKMP
jgi:hypothetical protein